MAKLYTSKLKTIQYIRLPVEKSYAKSVFWMYNIVIKKESPISRDKVIEKLEDMGISTRTYFYPLHIQPILKEKSRVLSDQLNSIYLSEFGFYLPSGLAINESQLKKVAESIIYLFKV